MQCQHCGADNKDSAKFCLSCGNRLAAGAPEVAAIRCAGCGQANKPNAKFCAKCGTSLTAGAPQTAIEPPAPSPATPQAADLPPAAATPDPLYEAEPVEPPAAAPAGQYIPRAEVAPAAGSGKSRAALLGVAALVVAVLGAGGAWWLSRSDEAPAPVAATAVQPPAVPAAEEAAEAAAEAEPPAASTQQAPQAEPPAAAAKPAPAQPSAEEIEARKAAQLARRKAAEEAKKRKLDEEKAQAEARARQQPAAQPVRNEAPPAAAPKSQGTAERVAACQKENIFKRELCMWQVCNNKWGKDGCPEYKSNDTQSNY